LGEEVEDSQESIDLLESIHSPRTLQEMRDFWANQHVESSHRIKPLPRETFGINKGVQREINPSTLFSPNTSTRELNMELLPKELHQLRERWRVSSPLKPYMCFDKDIHRQYIYLLEECKALHFSILPNLCLLVSWLVMFILVPVFWDQIQVEFLLLFFSFLQILL
jgi:hypothetical protein